jgi:hypothetical protein
MALLCCFAMMNITGLQSSKWRSPVSPTQTIGRQVGHSSAASAGDVYTARAWYHVRACVNSANSTWSKTLQRGEILYLFTVESLNYAASQNSSR